MGRVKLSFTAPDSPVYSKGIVYEKLEPYGVFKRVATADGSGEVEVVLENVQKGLHTYAVTSVGKTGAETALSDAPIAQVNVRENLDAPNAVTNFAAAQSGEVVNLTWTPPIQPKGVTYEIRRGSSWSGSQLVGEGITGASHVEAWGISGTTLTYRIKAKSATGNYSGEQTASVYIQALDNHEDGSGVDEHSAGFTATKANVELDGSDLVPSPLPTVIDSFTGVIDDYDFAIAYHHYPTGTYTAAEVDFGAVVDERIEVGIAVNVEEDGVAGLVIDDIKTTISPPADDGDETPHFGDTVIDGDERPVRIDTDIRLHNGTSYGSYFPYVPGVYRCQKYQLRWTLYSWWWWRRIKITSCAHRFRVKNKKREARGLVLSAGGVTPITYSGFTAVPSLFVRITDEATGDYTSLTNVTSTGADVEAFDSGDTRVARTIDWAALGT